MKSFDTAYTDFAQYEILKEPITTLMYALGKAMWSFAQIKEITWYQWGYQSITESIHKLEHDCGEYIDRLKTVMTQIGLPLIYPRIPAYEGNPKTVEDALNDCAGLIREVNQALSGLIEVTDNDLWEPIARQAEEIQIANFRANAWILQTWTMAENGESPASLDKWHHAFFAGTEKAEEDND